MASQAPPQQGLTPNQVTRAIWEGSLPVRITVHQTDLNLLGLKEVDPFYSVLPRCSYLPVSVTKQLKEHLTSCDVKVPTDDSELWYEYDGVPLKWHYPIGALYDLFNITRDTENGLVPPPLPWDLRVHLFNFPHDRLIRSQSPGTPQDMFMSMIKEADYLRNGSTAKVMNMSKSDSTQLWDALSLSDYDRFWNINQRLVTNDGQIPRHIPIRLYLAKSTTVIQEPVNPCENSVANITLGTVLSDLLPDLFPKTLTPEVPEISKPPSQLDDSGSPSMDIGEPNSQKTEGSPTTAPLSPQSGTKTDGLAKAIIHGICPSLDTNILWASQNLSYADNFLHVIIIQNTGQ